MNRIEFKYRFKEFFEGSRNANFSTRIISVFGWVYLAILIFLYLTHYFSEDQEGGPGSIATNILPWLIGIFLVILPILQPWLVWRGNPNVRCYLIPKRAFTDESDVKEFRELLDRKINQRQ